MPKNNTFLNIKVSIKKNSIKMTLQKTYKNKKIKYVLCAGDEFEYGIFIAFYVVSLFEFVVFIVEVCYQLI